MRKLSSNVKMLSEQKNIDDLIIYQLVDEYTISEQHLFRLQCLSTSMIKDATMIEIVTNPDFILGLHPVQASYIGLEVAKLNEPHPFDFSSFWPILMRSRYGAYIVRAINRQKQIVYEEKSTCTFYTLSPDEIIQDENLISEFDSTQAFHIGYIAQMGAMSTMKTQAHHSAQLYLLK